MTISKVAKAQEKYYYDLKCCVIQEVINKNRPKMDDSYFFKILNS